MLRPVVDPQAQLRGGLLAPCIEKVQQRSRGPAIGIQSQNAVPEGIAGDRGGPDIGVPKLNAGSRKSLDAQID